MGLNPLTTGQELFLPKTHFLDILEIFSLERGQISSDLLKKAFATWQHVFLFTSTMFHEKFAQACAENKILRQQKWSTCLGFFVSFSFFSVPFLFLLFTSFGCSDWPSTRLAYSSKNLENTSSRQANFATELLHVVTSKFALSFSLRFLSIFTDISGSTEPITLIWVSLERFYSFCRTLMQMMSLLVEGDDVRSETKVNAHCGRLCPPQESLG